MAEAGEVASDHIKARCRANRFDRSYIRSATRDHKDAIRAFQREIAAGRDPQATAFASATVRTLEKHLGKIAAIAASAGI
jgi:putative membrane protein